MATGLSSFACSFGLQWFVFLGGWGAGRGEVQRRDARIGFQMRVRVRKRPRVQVLILKHPEHFPKGKRTRSWRSPCVAVGRR